MAGFQIMTVDGWKPVGDFQTISGPTKITSLAGCVRHIKANIYCGWSPSSLGPQSGEFAHDWNIAVMEQAQDMWNTMRTSVTRPMGIPMSMIT